MNSPIKKGAFLIALISMLLACSVSVDTGANPTSTLFVPPPTVAPTTAVSDATPLVEASPTAAVDAPSSGEATDLPADAVYASVLYVIDGDTIQVSIEGVEYRVRYIGMNTPERDEPCYDDATNRNRQLVEDQIVILTKDVSETDPNGRLLRYVYVGDVFVNATLVQEGWAEARRYNPDTAQYEYFDSLEAVAADQGLGCWDAGVFER